MSVARVSPMRIDQLEAGSGVIGLCGTPGVGGTMAADLQAMADFGADAVVSLLEHHEYALMGAPELPARLQALTPERHDLPIRRTGVPSARFERIWAYSGHRLRQILRRGGRVLVHCHNGSGRTGVVAARLLVELGARADDAITRVCATRPRAIETLAQSQHVRACRAAVEDRDVAGRILGCLIGGAAGDAFGYPVEFLSHQRIRERFGPDGLVEPVLQGGALIVSDDTQMTLFTAQGVLSAIDDDMVLHRDHVTTRVRRGYLAWFRTQREEWSSHAAGLSQYRELWAARAPGSTCLTALKAGARGTPEQPINDSKGCGAVMRVAPLGLLPALDPDQAFQLADEAAALTHGHPSGRLSAAALASLIRDLLGGIPLEPALDRMEMRLEAAPGGAETLAAARQARTLAADIVSPTEAMKRLGEGWTGEEALAIALYAVLKAGSFEAALRLAANHDGDSDSTASIAGQIWGVIHGVDRLPHGWVDKLDVLEPLCDIAGRLVASFEAEDSDDVRRRLAVLAPFARRAANSPTACFEARRDFVRAVHASDWMSSFDWPTWQASAEFERLLVDPRALQRASHVQLRRLVTAIVRREYAGDGDLESHLRSGRISAMARRAEALLVAVAA